MDEFWGIELKSGESFIFTPEGMYLHLTQAALGEPVKPVEEKEYVCLQLTVGDEKLVLGHLHPDRRPQQEFDLVFEKEVEISHNWQNGSVYFCGTKDINYTVCSVITGYEIDEEEEKPEQSDGAYYCDICNRKFGSEDSLSSHKRSKCDKAHLQGLHK